MMRAALRNAWLLLALLAACSSTETVNTPTQVLLEVTCNDPELLARMDAVRVEVSSFESGGWRDAKPATFPIAKFTWPLEVPIFPRKGSDESRQFQVIVQALQGDVVLAETRALTRFARGRHKRLTRELYFCPEDPGRICAANDCRGEACKVCSKRGTCDEVDVLDTLPDGPTEGDLDGGARQDVDGAMTGEGDAAPLGSDSGEGMDGGTFDATGANATDASASDAGTIDAPTDTGAMDANANDANAATDAGPSVDAASDSGVDTGLPACPSGSARCAQGCVTIDMSPMNCGRCGRTCRSNGCNAGACAPTSIYTYTPGSADAGTFLANAALDQSFVYFQDPASVQIQRVTTAGSAPTLVSYKTPGDRIRLLRIDDGYLYANIASGGNDFIARMALSSDNFATVMGTEDLITIVVGMTTNTNQVIVAQTLSSNYIDAIPKTGASGYTRLATGPSLYGELEADDVHVYLRDASSIMRTLVMPSGTPPAPTVVAAFENGETCRDLAITSDRVLYASSQRVAIVSKSGGAITTLAALSARQVITDTDTAYFVHELGDDKCSGGFSLYRVPLAGGTPVRIAGEPANCRGGECCPGSLMQDSAALYWIRGDGLAIRRVEK